jgi:hypothetical protein
VGLVCCTTGASSALAQGLPDQPFVLANGRVVVSGDVSVTSSCSHAAGGAACAGDTGFFNFSDYENSTLRMLRAGVSTSVRISESLSALGEIRLENTEHPRPYGLYLRYRPFEGHDFDVQVGRVPSTFGAFARRAYSTDNPLIGYPLAYQYLTSLRPDALPATPDDVLRMRARGWLSSFPIGNQVAAAGLPLVDTFRWDTGVQVHGAGTWFDAAASVTTGSLSNPLFRDDNSGKHIAARVSARPTAGLVIGLSASRAPYVTSAAATLAHADPSAFVQEAAGFDVEYSRDHYIVRFETIRSTYDVATIEPRLRAAATMIEGRYKLTPRLHAAARVDHLGFNRITGTERTVEWDAPVTRWEIGGGYAIQRNAQVRLSVQHNTRDGGRVRRMTALAAQLLYWF